MNKTLEVDPVIKAVLSSKGYKVEKEIGRGGQGICYVVFSEKYGSRFVCKCMKLNKAKLQEESQAYQREIYSLTHLIHPLIVKIYDYFIEQAYLFMIIEWCEHGNLLSIIQERSKIHKSDNYNFDYIRKIIRDILSALVYCHEVKHISHHDIKPSNILIDSFGRAKLCDFGIAENLDNEKGQNSQNLKLSLRGSLFYMSPQMILCSKGKLDNYNMYAADIWAFGVTAYTLLCSHHPFKGYTKEEILNNQRLALDCSEQLRESYFFSKLPDNTPPDLVKIIEASLVFDENERATACELMGYVDVSKMGGRIYESISSPALLMLTPSLSTREAFKTSPILSKAIKKLAMSPSSLIVKPSISKPK